MKTDNEDPSIIHKKLAEAALNRLKDKQEYEKRQGVVDRQETESLSAVKTEESARHSLTFMFIKFFFGLIVSSWLFVLAYNYCAVNWIIDLKNAGLLDEASKISLLELDKVVSIIISALGTSLGFIIGYYFKSKNP